MKKQLKFGFDIHGVLDTFPVYAQMTRSLFEDGHEVHIITGIKRDHLVEKQLKDLGVVFTDYFSIVEHIEKNYFNAVTWDSEGLPHAPEELWNPAKASYCDKNDVDIIFDDSPIYGKYFESINTIYNHVQNTRRKLYKVRH